MPVIAEELARATERISKISETPRLDAELLLSHALGVDRASLLSRLQDSCEPEAFDELLSRREAGEPLAYIFGEWEFYSLSFECKAPTLVPRPETEHLVEAVLDFVGDDEVRVLEIGTGTGCVAASIASMAPHASVVATDIQSANLDLAMRNAARNEVTTRMEFREGDLFNALADTDQPFDVICSNPPYVEESAWYTLSTTIRDYEDRVALLSGKDGLDLIRQLIAQAPAHLCDGGMLCFEIGAGQADRVESLLLEGGYSNIHFVNDLAGIKRIAVART